MTSACEVLDARGVFTFECFDKYGALMWREKTPNVVTTVGKNFAFNTLMAGLNYTVTGPYLGLISGASFSGVTASDTMSLHPGWLECGNAHVPVYGTTRATCNWSAAANGTISLSTSPAFSFTDFGFVQGAFINFGPGALPAIDSTGGVLWSAASFVSGAPFSITTGAQLKVSYSVSM